MVDVFGQPKIKGVEEAKISLGYKRSVLNSPQKLLSEFRLTYF